MIQIGLQIPYAMVVGWELFNDKEKSGLPFKSFALHLAILSIEFCWDLDNNILGDE